MGTEYYKSLLNKQEMDAYDSIIRGFRCYETQISLSTFPPDSVGRIFESVCLDNPALFFLNNNYTVWTCGTETGLEVTYNYSLVEANRLLGQMNRIANEVVSKVRGMQDHQIATYIHDYLSRSLTYTNSINGRNESHSIVGALLNHKCVCEGYAKAYKFLCDKLGVPCIVVRGSTAGASGGPHGWNIVKIGGCCYHVDVTADKCTDGEYCSRAYLFLSTSEILNDHVIDSKFPVPYCPKSRIPLVRVNDMDGFVAAVRQDHHKKVRYSEYVLSSYVVPGDFIDKFTKRLSVLDLMLTNRILAFFYPDAPKVNVIGIKWR